MAQDPNEVPEATAYVLDPDVAEQILGAYPQVASVLRTVTVRAQGLGWPLMSRDLGEELLELGLLRTAIAVAPEYATTASAASPELRDLYTSEFKSMSKKNIDTPCARCGHRLGFHAGHPNSRGQHRCIPRSGTATEGCTCEGFAVLA